jgi:hypothetical protein
MDSIAGKSKPENDLPEVKNTATQEEFLKLLVGVMQNNQQHHPRPRGRPRGSTKPKATEEENDSSPPRKPVEFQLDIVAAMQGLGTLPKFKRKFKQYDRKEGQEEGNWQIVEVLEGNVVKKVTFAALVKAVAEYALGIKNPDYRFTAHGYKATAELFLQATPPLPEAPASFYFKSTNPDKYCFKRAPFDPHEKPCPDWDSMFDPMFNADGVMQTLWTFFVEGAYRQNYIYLKGEGGDGKGSIVRTLNRVTGDVYSITKPPAEDNKHAAVEFERSMIVAITDLRNMPFMRSELLLAFTGDDDMNFDHKGKQPYSAKPAGRLLVCSNRYLVIGIQDSEQRRAQYGEMPKRKTPIKRDTKFENRLFDQFPGFIWKCKQKFEALGIDPGEEIPQSPALKERLRSFAADDPTCGYLDFLSHFFTVKDLSEKPEENVRSFVTKVELDNLLIERWDGEGKESAKRREGFRQWLRAVHGIEAKRPYCNEKRQSMPAVYYRLERKKEPGRDLGITNDPASWGNF